MIMPITAEYESWKPIFTRLYGFTKSSINILANTALSEPGLFFCSFPSAIMENISEALVTDGDKPVNRAYNQISRMVSDAFNQFSLSFRMNESRKTMIPYIIPTCKPETASMCIAPAEE